MNINRVKCWSEQDIAVYQSLVALVIFALYLLRHRAEGGQETVQLAAFQTEGQHHQLLPGPLSGEQGEKLFLFAQKVLLAQQFQAAVADQHRTATHLGALANGADRVRLHGDQLFENAAVLLLQFFLAQSVNNIYK